MKYNAKQFGINVREVRKNREISQDQLALRAGIDRSYMVALSGVRSILRLKRCIGWERHSTAISGTCCPDSGMTNGQKMAMLAT